MLLMAVLADVNEFLWEWLGALCFKSSGQQAGKG